MFIQDSVSIPGDRFNLEKVSIQITMESFNTPDRVTEEMFLPPEKFEGL